MKIIKNILFFFTIITPTTNWQFKGEINAVFQNYTTDQLLNIYLTNNNTLKKYSKEFQLQYQYTEKQFGNITKIDATNPFKILVHFKDFDKLTFLDNTLSNKWEPIDLFTLNGIGNEMVCSSADNCFWILNTSKKTISRFNHSLSKLAESGPTFDLFSQQHPAVFMTEFNNKVFINLKNKGIACFDQFGTFIKTYPIAINNQFQVVNNSIWYLSNNKLLNFNMQSLNTDTISLPLKNYDSVFRIENNQLYLKQDSTLKIFQLN